MRKVNTRAGISTTDPEKKRSPSAIRQTELQTETGEKTKEIDSEIKSKERTLSLLNEKLPKDSQSIQLGEQLVLRDLRIDELNGRIQTLEAEASIGPGDSLNIKNKQIQSLSDERTELQSKIQALEVSFTALETDLRGKIKKLEEEKESAEAMTEGVMEEMEGVRALLKTKEEQNSGMKQDLLQLSTIVQEMSLLNTDLNSKITEMNKDMEQKNAAHYAATVKIEQTEELEKALSRETAKTQSMEKKLGKMLEDRARLEAIEGTSRISQEAIRILEEETMKIDHPKTAEIVQNVQRVRHELKKVTSPQKSVQDDPVLLKASIKDLQNANLTLEAENKRLKSLENVHTDRIQVLEQEKEKMKAEINDGNERLLKKVKVLQEAADKFRGRTEKAESIYQTAESELQRVQTQLLSLQNRIQGYKTQIQEMKTAETQQELMVRELKNQLSSFKTQQNAQQLSFLNREQKLKHAAGKQKALLDAVYKKETELLRKEGQRLKLEQEIKELKEHLQQSQASVKVKAAGDLSIIESRLEEKDREIGILKDMLRSSTHQVKHRDLDISRFKMKLENRTGVEGSPVSPLTTDRSARIVGLVSEIDSVLSVKEILEDGQTKLSAGVIKKRLRIETVPGDKQEILTLIAKKLELLLEDVQKEARVRGEVLVQARSFGEKIVSQGVKSIVESDIRTAELAERLKSVCNGEK